MTKRTDSRSQEDSTIYTVEELEMMTMSPCDCQQATTTQVRTHSYIFSKLSHSRLSETAKTSQR